MRLGGFAGPEPKHPSRSSEAHASIIVEAGSTMTATVASAIATSLGSVASAPRRVALALAAALEVALSTYHHTSNIR